MGRTKPDRKSPRKISAKNIRCSRISHNMGAQLSVLAREDKTTNVLEQRKLLAKPKWAELAKSLILSLNCNKNT